MNGLLKFITCGSVDDGKSTLIGHLLYDAKLIYADQKEALALDSKVGSRGGKIDYSLLLDGLIAEREQGITIDVAYRYFTTDRRSFICADTPGHEEYTRNMACGASFADLAIILVDAKQGVLTQTRRHARICSLMGIRYFIFALNKMDLVGYQKERFDEIQSDIAKLQQEVGLENVVIIPVSATEGDNITIRSENMPWYTGPTLLSHLEEVDVTEATENEQGFYMPVQRVCRPNHEFRGFQGQIEHGQVKVGDLVVSLPSKESAHVKSILVAGKEADHAFEGQPVTIQLDKEVDVSRGCVIEKDSNLKIASTFTTNILWMDDNKLEAGKNFMIKLGTKKIPGIVTKINYRIDVNTGEHINAKELEKNELAVCEVATSEPIILDTFKNHKTLGELIFIDRITNMTSACGVVLEVGEKKNVVLPVSKGMRAALNWQSPLVIGFSLENVDENEIHQAENLLLRSSHHTYTYRPEGNEDYVKVVEHLVDAGLVVLLVLDSYREEAKELEVNENYKRWSEVRKDSDSADAIFARVQSLTMLNNIMGPDNWII